jgi:hypothetical protein
MLDTAKALEVLKQTIDVPNKEYWSRLKDSADTMNEAQKQYVMSQESVRRVYEEMMGSFNSYLFEKFKDDFAAVPTFQPIIERYVDAVLLSAQDYGRHITNLEEENKRLRQQLEGIRNVSGHTTEGTR